MREHGCPWKANKRCENAVSQGHLELLKSARQRDCLWDEVTCVAAVEHKEVEVLKWDIDHGCPGGEVYAHHLTLTVERATLIL